MLKEDNMKLSAGLLCCLLLIIREGYAHNLGLHGLSGDNPTGDPNLPEITEAFEATVHIRFRRSGNRFQSIFHWTTADQSESIYIGHQENGGGAPRTKLAITRAGVTENCFATTSFDEKRNYVLRFSVDATGTGTIILDGTQIASCGGMGVPINVPRDHFLGRSPLDGDGDHRIMEGSITGLRITNDGDIPHHPSSAFQFFSFPGQSFGKGFVVSYYARFNELGNSNDFQPVFDFGNGLDNDNIWCGQRAKTTRMSCEVFYGGTGPERIEAPVDSLEEGEFAFWHIGLDADGRFWIQKDGVEVVAKNIPMPNAVFRRNMLISHDHRDIEDMLEGVVLGFRLDRLPTS